jgi:hypothetical protein
VPNLGGGSGSLRCDLVEGLIRRYSLLTAMLVVVGCGSTEDKTAVETPQSKAEASEEAAKWTPEQKAIFQKSMTGHAKMAGDTTKSSK